MLSSHRKTPTKESDFLSVTDRDRELTSLAFQRYLWIFLNVIRSNLARVSRFLGAAVPIGGNAGCMYLTVRGLTYTLVGSGAVDAPGIRMH